MKMFGILLVLVSFSVNARLIDRGIREARCFTQAGYFDVKLELNEVFEKSELVIDLVTGGQASKFLILILNTESYPNMSYLPVSVGYPSTRFLISCDDIKVSRRL